MLDVVWRGAGRGVLTAAWAVALTVVFVATGVYGVVRLGTRRWEGMGAVVDLNHVVMSVAMVVMVWWPSFVAGRWVQIAVFAGLAVVFVQDLVGAESVTARAGALAHAAMNAGMVWMLVAMPALMAAGPGLGMDMPGMHHGAVSAGVQAWAAFLTWDVVGVLVLAAAWWTAEVVRSRRHRVLCCCHGLSCAAMAAMLAVMTPGL